MSRVTIPYKPREAFASYHDSPKRFSLTVAHRRAGKTVARINKLIREAIECDKLNPRFGYLAPFYVQAKDIAWLYLKHYASPVLEYGGKVNESELSITFPHNGAIVKLYGAENAERMRGLYFDGIVIDEAQGISKTVLTTIILPALADRLGWLDVSGTPRGWENLLGELVKIARNNPDEWFLQILRASQTGLIPQDELNRQRQLMPENEYEQEFECNFEAAITGAVYGSKMSEALKSERIGSVSYDPEMPTYTSWDLGFDDSTAIWFWQIAKQEIRLIDYYEASGQDIGHYCDVLHARNYTYDVHYVPHDAANKLLAAGGRSIYQQMRELLPQKQRISIIAATSQQNSIEAARKTIEICWFDETKCERGIDALRQYQFEYDDDKKTFRSKPLHNWASHGADAFEIIGQVWRNPPEPKKTEPMKGATQMTIEQMIAAQRRKRLNAD